MDFLRDSKTIKEIYEMYRRGVLILQPFFQRNLVWTDKAKSRFIESILLNLPITEIYLYEDENGTLSVIDGQQRLSTIFNFIERRFNLIDLEKKPELDGLSIDFIEDEVDILLNFRINYVLIAKTVKKGEIINMYSRINEYTVNLNDQELRKAAYNDSDFLKLSEELSLLEFFGYGRFFTKRKRERMNDIEYISELLALQLYGIQDKKLKLDTYYAENTKMSDYIKEDRKFREIIAYIESIFSTKHYFEDTKKKYDGSNPSKNIGITRFNQQADFYSLFCLSKYFIDNNIVFTEDQRESFLKLLLILDYLIEPEADIDIFSTYAVKCISQGNTKNSRIFRYEILKDLSSYILTGTENNVIESMKNDFKEIFEIEIDFKHFDVINIIKQIEIFYEEVEN